MYRKLAEFLLNLARRMRGFPPHVCGVVGLNSTQFRVIPTLRVGECDFQKRKWANGHIQTEHA
jgi:hypothetical protein